MRIPHLLIGGLIAAAACSSNAIGDLSSEDRAGFPARGGLIQTDSLTSVDGAPLPCCTADSAGSHITILSGRLDFYADAQYTDTVITPEGPRSGACVQGVPDGSIIQRNGVLTLPGGGSYLLMPCSIGVYEVTLSEFVDGGSGPPSRDVSIALGSYSWAPNALSVGDQGTSSGHISAGMSAATITLTIRGHRYRFVATSRF